VTSVDYTPKHVICQFYVWSERNKFILEKQEVIKWILMTPVAQDRVQWIQQQNCRWRISWQGERLSSSHDDYFMEWPVRCKSGLNVMEYVCQNSLRRVLYIVIVIESWNNRASQQKVQHTAGWIDVLSHCSSVYLRAWDGLPWHYIYKGYENEATDYKFTYKHEPEDHRLNRI
jgi:hypothetical protein